MAGESSTLRRQDLRLRSALDRKRESASPKQVLIPCSKPVDSTAFLAESVSTFKPGLELASCTLATFPTLNCCSHRRLLLSLEIGHSYRLESHLSQLSYSSLLNVVEVLAISLTLVSLLLRISLFLQTVREISTFSLIRHIEGLIARGLKASRRKFILSTGNSSQELN